MSSGPIELLLGMDQARSNNSRGSGGRGGQSEETTGPCANGRGNALGEAVQEVLGHRKIWHRRGGVQAEGSVEDDRMVTKISQKGERSLNPWYKVPHPGKLNKPKLENNR